MEKKVELVSHLFFFLLSSKVTVDGDYSHGIRRCLLTGRNAMTNLGSILKSETSFPDKDPEKL